MVYVFVHEMNMHEQYLQLRSEQTILTPIDPNEPFMGLEVCMESETSNRSIQA